MEAEERCVECLARRPSRSRCRRRRRRHDDDDDDDDDDDNDDDTDKEEYDPLVERWERNDFDDDLDDLDVDADEDEDDAAAADVVVAGGRASVRRRAGGLEGERGEESGEVDEDEDEDDKEDEDAAVGKSFFRVSLVLLIAAAWTTFATDRAASDDTMTVNIGFGGTDGPMNTENASETDRSCRNWTEGEGPGICSGFDSIAPTASSSISLRQRQRQHHNRHPHPSPWTNPPFPSSSMSSFDPPVRSVRQIFTCGLSAWLIPATELLFTEYCPHRLYPLNALTCRVGRVVRRAHQYNVSLQDALLIVRPTIQGMGFVHVGNDDDDDDDDNADADADADAAEFLGKVLYLNTENDAFPIPTNQYGLGPYNDTNHTMRLYLASLYLNTLQNDMKSLILSPGTALKPKNTKRHFALFVASNHCTTFRLDAVIRLSKIGIVHVAGHCVRYLRKRCHESSKQCRIGPNERIVHVPVSKRAFDRETEITHELRNQSFWTLHEYYRNYRFAMVFENRKLHGYVTEKIVNAFLGGSIPIYFGTEDVFTIFNPKAMIYYNRKSVGATLNAIRYLERNESAYDAILMNEPILANGTQTVEDVFSLNVSHGNGRLRERIRRMVF